jgi:hypothetical protein
LQVRARQGDRTHLLTRRQPLRARRQVGPKSEAAMSLMEALFVSGRRMPTPLRSSRAASEAPSGGGGGGGGDSGGDAPEAAAAEEAATGVPAMAGV